MASLYKWIVDNLARRSVPTVPSGQSSSGSIPPVIDGMPVHIDFSRWRECERSASSDPQQP